MPENDVTGVDLDIEFMYAAGKVYIPDTADDLYKITKRLHAHMTTFNEQSALAGDPAGMVNLLTVVEECYRVLQPAVTTLNNMASAVIKTADDFVRTDDEARTEFNNMNAQVDGTDLGGLPTPRTPETPTVEEGAITDEGTDTTPSTQQPGSLEDDAEQREENEDSSEYEHEREKRRG